MSGDPAVTCVAAVSEQGVVAANGKLPWKLRRDYRHHLELVRDRVVVLGRRTFEQYTRPPGRAQIVFTHSPETLPPGVTPVTCADEATAAARALGADELFVLGGNHVYGRMFPRCDKFHLTVVHGDVVGDLVLPLFALTGRPWRLLSEESWPADAHNSHDATYRVYVKDPAPSTAWRPDAR